jgi:hypothetical protein
MARPWHRCRANSKAITKKKVSFIYQCGRSQEVSPKLEAHCLRLIDRRNGDDSNLTGPSVGSQPYFLVHAGGQYSSKPVDSSADQILGFLNRQEFVEAGAREGFVILNSSSPRQG